MAKYDENKVIRDLRGLVKVEITTTCKWLKATKGTLIGIRRWGKIDFLTNYCGYRFVWVDPPKKVVDESNKLYINRNYYRNNILS